MPAQSYLDCSTSAVSLNVALQARCWHPEYTYAGRNVYAAFLALTPPDTYDIISLQLYETWSLASCMMAKHRAPLVALLDGLICKMCDGWEVGFDSEPSLRLANQTVSVSPTRLLIGLANGGWPPSGGLVLQCAACWHTCCRGICKTQARDPGASFSGSLTLVPKFMQHSDPPFFLLVKCVLRRETCFSLVLSSTSLVMVQSQKTSQGLCFGQ